MTRFMIRNKQNGKYFRKAYRNSGWVDGDAKDGWGEVYDTLAYAKSAARYAPGGNCEIVEFSFVEVNVHPK